MSKSLEYKKKNALQGRIAYVLYPLNEYLRSLNQLTNKLLYKYCVICGTKIIFF